MNETIQVLLSRRAIRAYENKPVSRADLETIVQCGQYAATGMGLQPWHFTVVTDRALLDQISQANRRVLLDDPNTPPPVREMAQSDSFDSFRGAPACIFVCGENDAVNTIADCANATQNMAVAAKALGLGSCYLASHKVSLLTPAGAALKEKLGIPAGYIPYFALAVGYAAEDPQPAPRKEGAVNFVG